MYQTHQVRTTFGSCDVKKVHALWREAHFEIKMHKPHQLRSTFGSWDVENVYAVVARSTFPSQNVKNTTCSDHSWRFRCDFAWQVQGILHLAKSELTANREGFVAFPKKMARVGHLKRIWTDACRVAGAVQDMFIRDVRRSRHWFPERGCILEHQIFRFAQMILRDRCSTSYDLASLFRGRRVLWTDGMENSQNALARGRQLCTQLFIFEGSLAELLHFCWCCQIQKLRMSRRIASFSSLQMDR